jgi:hypothetical protein
MTNLSPLPYVDWDPEERLQLFRDYLAAFPGDHNGVTNNSARFQGFAAGWSCNGQGIEDEETGFYP